MFLRQADVGAACLNSTMPDEVYVRLRSICGDEPVYVRRLAIQSAIATGILRLAICGIVISWHLQKMKVPTNCAG